MQSLNMNQTEFEQHVSNVVFMFGLISLLSTKYVNIIYGHFIKIGLIKESVLDQDFGVLFAYALWK